MFSFDIKTTIDIEASASEIWHALTELDAYHQWNPMLQHLVDIAPRSCRIVAVGAEKM